jgi:manganese efflux pump family protein
MLTAFKMVALVVSLGLDTLTVSTAIGMRKSVDRLRIGLTFACFEALMPLAGLFIGKGLAGPLGTWTSIFGALLLIGVGGYLMFFEDDDDDKLDRPLAGWGLILTALSISLDELAIGFSISLVHVPLILTISLIALQAILFSYMGLTFGSKLRPYLGEWAEKVGGAVLGLLGVWLIVERLIA